MKEINLLPRKNLGILEQERTIMIVRTVATLCVVLVVSTMIGVFLLGRSYSLADIANQQAQARSQLQLVKNKIQKQLMLVDRANHIQTILKIRKPVTEKISTIQKQLPADVTVESFTITDLVMTVSASSPSLASIKTFIDSLTAMVEKKTLLKRLTINNVVLNAQTGQYTVSIQGVLL